MLFMSLRFVSCCWTFNFIFEASYVELVMFICQTLEMFKVALCGSSVVIYVIVNGMCVCLILGIWWITYRNLFLANDVSVVYVVRYGLTRGTLSHEYVLALILLTIIDDLVKMVLNWGSCMLTPLDLADGAQRLSGFSFQGLLVDSRPIIFLLPDRATSRQLHWFQLPTSHTSQMW
jgi:hypothetical protein